MLRYQGAHLWHRYHVCAHFAGEGTKALSEAQRLGQGQHSESQSKQGCKQCPVGHGHFLPAIPVRLPFKEEWPPGLQEVQVGKHSRKRAWTHSRCSKKAVSFPSSSPKRAESKRGSWYPLGLGRSNKWSHPSPGTAHHLQPSL